MGVDFLLRLFHLVHCFWCSAITMQMKQRCKSYNFYLSSEARTSDFKQKVLGFKVGL